MTIPTYQAKYDKSAFMTPETRLEHRYGDPSEWPSLPDVIILTFQDYLFESIASRPESEAIDLETNVYSMYTVNRLGVKPRGTRPALPVDVTDEKIGIVGEFGIGAPTLAIIVEELIALGGDIFCIVGGCATLQPAVEPGDIVIAETAIRDEGTSYHYLEASEPAEASPSLVTELEMAADNCGIPYHTGVTWTTDAFYRETKAEIEHFATDGVLTVEMEASALFAIADIRDVISSAVFAPFDRLTDAQWEWKPAEKPEERLEDVFSLAVTAGTNLSRSYEASE
ncbi:MAG: nucleoside phosphorylase [Halobacteriaceae archaeon]